MGKFGEKEKNIFELIDEGNCIHIHTKKLWKFTGENHGFFSEENFIGSLSMIISCFLEYVYKWMKIHGVQIESFTVWKFMNFYTVYPLGFEEWNFFKLYTMYFCLQ